VAYVIDWKSKPAPWNKLGREIADHLKNVVLFGSPARPKLMCANCGRRVSTVQAMANHRKACEGRL